MSQYLSYGGVDNFYNMILFLSNIFANSNYKFTKPKPLPCEGIYHPKYESTLTLEEYLQKKYDPGLPTIGIWFLHVLINMVSFSTTVLDEKSKNVFDRLDIPVIKAILFLNKKEERENSFQQLNSMNTAISTDMPELDANLASVPVVFKNISFIDSLTGAKITKYAAEKEYISKLVHLILNLYLIHKKTVTTFYNYPSCNYSIELHFFRFHTVCYEYFNRDENSKNIMFNNGLIEKIMLTFQKLYITINAKAMKI
nr:cobaltochelatase subunit CobN [Clostridium ljungdahlii]